MSKFIRTLQPSTVTAAIALAFALSGVITTPNTYAQDTESSSNNRQTRQQQSDDNQNSMRTQQREALELKRQEAQSAKEAAEAKLKAQHEARQEKLSASQLEICKNREANINSHIARIADRTTKHLEVFNTVSERAQAFYSDKGYKLDNYDELVADVAAKKAAAEIAVASIQETTASFDCEDENPKAIIEAFKGSLTSSIDVLKDYRTSVKNLIMGIKSATPSTHDNDSDATEDNE